MHDSRSEPRSGSDRVNLGGHATIVLTSTPKEYKLETQGWWTLVESGARLTRSLPLLGSDIECYIAAAANVSSIEVHKRCTTQRQNRGAVATGSILGRTQRSFLPKQEYKLETQGW